LTSADSTSVALSGTGKVCAETAMYFKWSLTERSDVVWNGTALKLGYPPLKSRVSLTAISPKPYGKIPLSA
jgi:hypothetical protein